jgi:hypothetical protein
MLAGSSTTKEFVARVSGALAAAGRSGIRVTAGMGACDLETQQIAGHAFKDDLSEDDAAPRHLEGMPKPVDPGQPDDSSRLCYFLDGVQATHEIGRIGPVPIIVTSVAAAIVNRCDRRFSRMVVEGLPAVVRAVILPLDIDDERVRALRELLRAESFATLGYEEAPHTANLILSSTEHACPPEPTDYVGMKEKAFGRARSLRERLEAELLRRWEGDDRILNSEDWIAVDGQLPWAETPSPRAVGLIKSVARPEFEGEDITTLLDLAQGMRTTSFVPGWQLRRATTDQRCSWYARLWPPQRGADALGSLIRIEAPLDTKPEEVDEITRWILAERAPLAKPDPRWPAMIYPIHHVEKILKPLVQGSERAFSRLERQLATPAMGRN